MQITVEFENASQIATLAHLAEIMKLSRKNDAGEIACLYPRDVIDAVRNFLDHFDVVLNYIDSPYVVSEEIGKEASSLAYRMQTIGTRILEMKDE